MYAATHCPVDSEEAAHVGQPNPTHRSRLRLGNLQSDSCISAADPERAMGHGAQHAAHCVGNGHELQARGSSYVDRRI